MTFNIKSVLKKAWEGIQKTFDAHGPFDPAADVKKRLEDKGYCFRRNATTFPIGVPAVYFDIIAPDGRRVCHLLFTEDQTTNEYYRDYDAAVEECQMEAKQKQNASSKTGMRP